MYRSKTYHFSYRADAVAFRDTVLPFVDDDPLYELNLFDSDETSTQVYLFTDTDNHGVTNWDELGEIATANMGSYD